MLPYGFNGDEPPSLLTSTAVPALAFALDLDFGRAAGLFVRGRGGVADAARFVCKYQQLSPAKQVPLLKKEHSGTCQYSHDFPFWHFPFK